MSRDANYSTSLNCHVDMRNRSFDNHDGPGWRAAHGIEAMHNRALRTHSTSQSTRGATIDAAGNIRNEGAYDLRTCYEQHVAIKFYQIFFPKLRYSQQSRTTQNTNSTGSTTGCCIASSQISLCAVTVRARFMRTQNINRRTSVRRR